MDVGPDIAATAGLIGEPARSMMLSILMGGESYPASMLAAGAGISPQTASAHLSKLVNAGLIRVRRNGRYRLYCLSDPRVADALEALAGISPQHVVRSLHQSDDAAALKTARMCYDHLAGRIGVGIAELLASRSLIVAKDGAFEITKRGASWLSGFGIEPRSLTASRRKLATQCLDWSERRPHVGGALGAAIAQRTIALGWFKRTRVNRSLKITSEGERALASQFRIQLSVGSVSIRS